MTAFLFWIGIYNLIGGIVLGFMLKESFANDVLHRWTKVWREPYRHGEAGAFWLFWAAVLISFMAGVMLFGSQLDPEIQRALIYLVLFVYLIFYFGLLSLRKNPKFGPGLTLTQFLWLAQICWGVFSVSNN